LWKAYCCPTAATPPTLSLGALNFLRDLQAKKRADERTRTADLLHLRVMHQALQGCAEDCKCRIFRGVSFPCLAEYCTVLRSRWYQSGIRSPRTACRRFLQRSRNWMLERFANRVVLCKDVGHGHLLERPKDQGTGRGGSRYPQEGGGRDLLHLAYHPSSAG
jgi:hypothetical protein